MFIIFRRRYGVFGARSIAQSMSKAAAGTAALTVVCYILIHWPGFYAGGVKQKALALAAVIAFSTATYFAAAWLLNSRELADLRLMRRAKPQEFV